MTQIAFSASISQERQPNEETTVPSLSEVPPVIRPLVSYKMAVKRSSLPLNFYSVGKGGQAA